MQSNRKIRLLVEGSEDRKVFLRLISEVADNKDDPASFINSVSIDVSEQLIEIERYSNQRHEKIGAREKVEIVCRAVENKDYASKLIGFVDREFRGFEIDERLADSIGSHKVDNRLIWSRGHSIENYFFEKLSMKRWIRSLIEQEWFEDIISSINAFFESALIHACAISLAVREVSFVERIEGLTEKVDSSIDYRLIFIDSSTLSLNYEEWAQRLLDWQKLPPEVVEAVIAQTKNWIERLNGGDPETYRWLCRGHTGMKFLSAWLESCTSYADPSSISHRREVPKKHLGQSNVKESKRFISFTDIWIQRALKNECVHPIGELRALGLDL